MNDDREELDKEIPVAGWTEAELDLTTLDTDLLPLGHRSGFVTVVGRPNVGKSTLMNAYLGQKVAIVSAKPQTTRLRQLGILTAPDYQVVFVDTPGWHTPQNKLGEFMVETAARALSDTDLILFLVDVSEPPTADDRHLAQLIAAQRGVAIIIAMNKADLIAPDQAHSRAATYHEMLPAADWMLVSALHGDNQDRLLARMVEALPEGPRYYPADQVTDTRTRDLVAELVREQALKLLRQEVPHAVAVLVNDFKERREDLVYVSATIYVEKESQKGILIGSKGRMLKQIGAGARAEIEKVLGVRAYLDLWVKVRSQWRRKEDALRQFGYSNRR